MPHHAESGKMYVDAGRFVFTSLNFIMSLVFAMILLFNAFNMDNITSHQIFHADRVLQTSGSQNIPATTLSTFIKQAYGADSEIIGMVDRTSVKSDMLPTMYEVSGSNSILRLEAVHCNFMLFSALWIASAFSLAMVQFPGTEPLYWSHARVVIVHLWNLVGLIATIVIFSATTKWASIPTSNLFYALIGQLMAWTYQYFHMVECTQIVMGHLQLEYKSANIAGNEAKMKSIQFSTELRKIIYMEFSVVAPMMLVAGVMPGAIGIDEWRIQTILFSSWTLFALLGLHLRFRKSLEDDDNSERHELKDINGLDGDQGETIGKEHGLDAIGYLTYAVVMVYVMLINALQPVIFYDPPFATTRIIQCRWGARVLFIVTGVFVIETIVKTIIMRVMPSVMDKPSGDKPHSVWPAFMTNFIFVAFGSFLVKILLFAGLSDVNALSTWYI
jgi:hypothetical protein